MAELDVSRETAAYLAALRERTQDEISAWRHELERADARRRGLEAARHARARDKAFREHVGAKRG